MLPDREIAKLCRGRIVYASFHDSSGSGVAGPHNAVILDSDEEVREHDSYFVAVISSNEEIDKEYNIPVPGYTGLRGFVKCKWIEEAHLRAIESVKGKILGLEMNKIAAMVRMAKSKKPTQS
ncbi:MAG: type II toxin-antitoxin system PemK/MazF family toxin [Planctomycetes bacterium]|nr:type II toxin-antitoxin system PemK/MazF family toxin [Planctomycetota bacterium]